MAELRLIPIPLSVVSAPAGPAAGPSGGAPRLQRRAREDDFWSVAAALLATGQISEDEYGALVGATAVVAIDA